MSIKNNNLPWIEKYRPETLNEIIDHKEKIDTLKALIAKNELTHLLFYGGSGCGKTSLILACAREMYGDQYKKYILELNASDDRGIETVRKKIPDFIKSTSNKIKLVILDEADAMTNDAQSALRRVIEKYSKNSRFCLICNNINKIIPGLQSRCTKMRFSHLHAESIKDKLTGIIALENVQITDQALLRLISLNRDFRQILNTLQCLHAIKSCGGDGGTQTSPIALSTNSDTYQPIQSDEINSYLGLPTPKHISEIIHIVSHNSIHQGCQQMLDLFKDNQWNLTDLLHLLSEYVVTEVSMPDQRKMLIIEKLADIEVRLCHSNDTEVQLYSLVTAFH